MQDFELRFCVDDVGWPNSKEGYYVFDLLDDGGIGYVPKSGGAYVLGTSDGTLLRYPWGSSAVFYIGKSSSLWRRLRKHRNRTIGAIKDHDSKRWLPRYQFGAAFGTDFAYYSRRGPQNEQNIEASLINCFYDRFGSIPVANSAWPQHL